MARFVVILAAIVGMASSTAAQSIPSRRGGRSGLAAVVRSPGSRRAPLGRHLETGSRAKLDLAWGIARIDVLASGLPYLLLGIPWLAGSVLPLTQVGKARAGRWDGYPILAEKVLRMRAPIFK